LLREKQLKLSRVGIDEGFSFPGFCNHHDNEIFSCIEKKDFDPFDSKAQSLFAYRTVCLELRKKEIAKGTTIKIAKQILESKRNNWEVEYLQRDQEINDFSQAIKDLNLFKTQLENEIFHSKQSCFNYTTLELPFLDICISTPLNIFDPNNDKSYEFDEYGFDKEDPISTSVLNFFPYKNSSFLIVANHKEYTCNWTSDLIKKLRDYPDLYLKEISDLITFRCEFWAISERLYDSISKSKIIEFEELLSENNYSHEYSINHSFNLFEE
jgi:hypothetical protein